MNRRIPPQRNSAPRQPEPAQPEINRLIALYQAKQWTRLEAEVREMVARDPDNPVGWTFLGLALQGLERLPEAVAALTRAVRLAPQDAGAHSNLGAALKACGRIPEAEASYRKALAIQPNHAGLHYNMGNLLRDSDRLAEAEASYRRALDIRPDYVAAQANLGSVFQDLGRFTEAETAFRRVLEIDPDSAKAHNNLGNALKELGRFSEAEGCYRRALAIKQDNAETYSNLLFLHSYHSSLDAGEYLALARNWEQSCVPVQDRQSASHRCFLRKPLPGRRLRVGYVSGDYRQHAVSYFVEQLFAHHGKTRIELFAYSNHYLRDVVTERLQGLAEHWVSVVGMADTTVMDRIESDGIDVLIDLSGHTEHNRLGVFARRAAPVQAHYLGYFASTGLTEMDYWVGDEILTPADTDSHFSEQVWRLPRVWVSYDGKANAPQSNWRPSQNGTVWAGSFNNLGKLTPATLALWAKVLHALPEGKLLLKTKELADAGNRQRILGTMLGHGITSDRIELQDRNATPDWPAHMAYYNRLDIALDPVGAVGGGTTTCDALWMGVPVITLEGDRMASRMTSSMLDAIGRPEWIAHSEAEYVDKVVALARDMEQRKTLRSGQRNRMANSPLCDARDLAMSLENAYIEMFERWFNEKNQQVCTTT